MTPDWMDFVNFELVVPLGIKLAHDLIEVDLISLETYQALQERLKQDCLFVVAGNEFLERNENMTTWKGLRLICKEIEIAGVWFKYNHDTEKASISCLQTWNRDTQQYSTLASSLTPHIVLQVITAFLYAEGIIPQPFTAKEAVLN